MKLTLSWLKTHLDTAAELDEIVRSLTMLGLEVDGVTDRSQALAPFTVAEIVSAEPHPNADKLRVCVVETGTTRLQIVCGAPNARAGLKTVLAPGGSVIPRTGTVLKPSTIRGIESNGMLCSGYELGITEDREGIVELPADAPVGEGFAHYAGLDDPLLDVKITANRADCLGVRGIARDLAAAGLGTLKPLAADTITGHFPSPIGIRIEDEAACPLFVGRWIRGVKSGPSPQWLVDRLTSIGLRPISALVDITNFMTFDLDRPLHVFDAGNLRGGLTIRPARDGESLAALNGREYALEPGMTVIADDSGAISLGGVIGGASTGCSETTTDVFIEAALFDPIRTAATGRRLNLQSDARYRFERGLDPAFVFKGMEIATRLVLDLCGGEPGEIAVAGAEPDWRRLLTLRPARVASLGGLAVPDAEIRTILETLGCIVEQAGDALAVIPPSWRADIEGEADLVEEVLRIHGYDDIPVTALPRETALPAPALDPGQRRASLVRRVLATRGLDEAVTYSFMPSAVLGAGNGALFGPIPPSLVVGESDQRRSRRHAAEHPAEPAAGRQAQRRSRLRRCRPVRGRATISQRYAGRADARGGRHPGRPDPAQKLGRADRTGRSVRREGGMRSPRWLAAGVPVENLQVTADPPGWYHPGRGGAIRLGPKTVLAHFGEIHPRLLRELDLAGPAMGFEIHLDAIPPARGRQRASLKLSPFQPVSRDFSFILDEKIAAEQVLRAARAVDRKLVADVRLFDLYTGPGVPEGKKSLAIAVTLQPVEATLTDEQIETFSKALVAQVAKATGGTLRG